MKDFILCLILLLTGVIGYFWIGNVDKFFIGLRKAKGFYKRQILNLKKRRK